MKKKTLIISLVLTLALVLGGVQSVFAGVGPATDVTKDAIASNRTTNNLTSEVETEKMANTFALEVVEGKYEVISEAQLAQIYQESLVIDTMPYGWYKLRHIPGAINQVIGKDGTGLAPQRYPIQEEEKTALLAKVKEKVGTKTVTKWYNKKTKKWTTKKPAKKYRGESKKVQVVNKDYPIVVYCGFTGCARSHEGAKYLVEQGYTNVMRLSGGICSWVDGGHDIEGDDIAG